MSNKVTRQSSSHLRGRSYEAGGESLGNTFMANRLSLMRQDGAGAPRCAAAITASACQHFGNEHGAATGHPANMNIH